MPSRTELLDNFINKEYLINHMKDYGELLKNEFHEDTRFFKNPRLILDRFDSFFMIMSMIKNGDIAKLYDGVIPDSIEYKELRRQIKLLEYQLF